MSIAQLARASSIGYHCGSVARDAHAVAERTVKSLPEREGGVLGGVVGSGLKVAADGDVEVQVPVTGKQIEHVVKEADPGVAAPSRCRRGSGSGARRSQR